MSQTGTEWWQNINVSRETFSIGELEQTVTTIETEPELAASLAGGRLAPLRAFADALVKRGELLGLIGPEELPRLWTRHLLNSALLAPLLPQKCRVADVGTGGGFPGLVLAIIRPDVTFTLIESMERRCEWLWEQAQWLNLENVHILHGRAEEFHDRLTVDRVTARAVSSLRKLLPITVPLLCDDGELLLLKGQRVHTEIQAAEKVIKKFRLIDARVELLGENETEVTRVFRATVKRRCTQ